MKKRYIIGISLAIIGLAIFILTRPKDNLVINVAPSSAEVIIDGKPYSSGGKRLEPGKYTITAKKDGFTSPSKTVTVSDDKLIEVDLLLNPVTAEAYGYLRDNPDEQLEREALGGKLVDIRSDEASKKTPLINELPFIDLMYRIDYGPSHKNRQDTAASAIYITLYDESARSQALDWIRYKGYDPEKLEIIYVERPEDHAH